MPRPIINGTLQPIRKGTRVSYDPSRGQMIVREWEGAGDNLNGLAYQCAAANMSYELHPGRVRSRLIATATSAPELEESIVDSWQLLADEIQKDIKEAPAVRALHRNDLAFVVKNAKKYNDGKTLGDDWWEFYDDAEGLINPDHHATIRSLFEALTHGHDVFNISRYVLRHTVNIPADTTKYIGDSYANYILDTATLLGEISSNAWRYPCPARLRYKIGSIPAMAATGSLVWGWRKLVSTETAAANNRVDVSQEYQLALWDTLVYPAVGGWF
jgi:hypothetical protein